MSEMQHLGPLELTKFHDLFKFQCFQFTKAESPKSIKIDPRACVINVSNLKIQHLGPLELAKFLDFEVPVFPKLNVHQNLPKLLVVS